MLVRPFFRDISEDSTLAILAGFLNKNQPEREEQVIKGVYWSRIPFNFRHTLAYGLTYDQEYPDLYERYSGGLSGYGVADSVDQILQYYAQPIADPVYRYVIGLTEVRKADQPPRDGWRWHKWGEYIGNKQPQCEYLADEPQIDSVITFSIIDLTRQLSFAD